MYKEIHEKSNKGITLVALVVTIVVLLILAGITITYVMGENSVFKQAQNAKLQTEIAKAREKLEVTFGHAKLLKHTDRKYNQEDYLDDLMEKEIPGIEIKCDVVIVDGYAFEIDRSEPKIGQYIGKGNELVFPEVTVTTPVISSDSRTATFTIHASEETKGISRIEIWLSGQKIDTISYDTPKTETTENYSVNRNGVYKVKAYADLAGSAKVTVEGLVPAVEFSPKGSDTWKKEHSTKIAVKELAETTITEMKYIWTDSVQEPEETKFVETCTNNSTITGKGYTGKYHLWIWYKTSDNKTNICGSDEFYFDNEGPTVNLASVPDSQTAFTLTATAKDENSGILRYEFYIGGTKVDTKGTSEGTATYQWTGTGMTENVDCSVAVYDALENKTEKSIKGQTQLYAWMECPMKYEWYVEQGEPQSYSGTSGTWSYGTLSSRPSQSTYFDSKTGRFTSVGSTNTIRASTATVGKSYSGYWLIASGSSATLATADISVKKGDSGNYLLVSRTTWSLYARQREIGHETTGPLVYSTDRGKYPDNDKQNGKWYIYKDIE